MLFVLELLLLLLLVISYYIQDKNYISPSTVYVAFFVFSVAWAIAYSKEWQLELNIQTFLVLLTGSVDFVLVSYLVHALFKRINDSDSLQSFRYDEPITKTKDILFIIFVLFTILITLAELRSITGESEISKAIYSFRNSNAFSSNSIGLSAVPYYCGIISRASGYWYAYYIGSSIGYKHKVTLLSFFSFFLCLCFSLLSGGRNDLICMLLALLFIAIYSRTRFKHSRGQILDLKTIIKSLVLGLIGIISFAYLTSIIGRNVEKTNYLYYIAVYSGASIKNLNTFLSETIVHSHIWGQYTFVNLWNYYGVKYDVSEYIFSPILPYNSVNGLGLGNVYTLYFAFVKDFGYLGLFILVSLMAIISQFIYEKMKQKYVTSNMFTILYGFIVGLLALSFFSNKFYETVFDVTFVKYIICWILLNTFFNKNKLVFKFSL